MHHCNRAVATPLVKERFLLRAQWDELPSRLEKLAHGGHADAGKERGDAITLRLPLFCPSLVYKETETVGEGEKRAGSGSSEGKSALRHGTPTGTSVQPFAGPNVGCKHLRQQGPQIFFSVSERAEVSAPASVEQ